MLKDSRTAGTFQFPSSSSGKNRPGDLRVITCAAMPHARRHMLTIEQVDTNNKLQVKRFVELPYKLYRDCPQWVPPLYVDAYLPLNRKKHPFFEHSEADFFV